VEVVVVAQVKLNVVKVQSHPVEIETVCVVESTTEDVVVCVVLISEMVSMYVSVTYM
jgi:hypothetical protein